LHFPGNSLASSFFKERNFNMSQHPSFKAGTGSGKKRRNVLKRFERVSVLQKRGEWKEGDRVTGLIKTKPED
jgi:small basic protein (TIGR04137 family)